MKGNTTVEFLYYYMVYIMKIIKNNIQNQSVFPSMLYLQSAISFLKEKRVLSIVLSWPINRYHRQEQC